jgi:hypothetical protein
MGENPKVNPRRQPYRKNKHGRKPKGKSREMTMQRKSMGENPKINLVRQPCRENKHERKS